MTIKDINFKSLLVASLAGGWAMFFLDHHLSGFLGFGMFPGLESPGWLVKHQVDAILIALPFAWPFIYNRLPGGGWLKGLVYGFLWWVVVLFIGGMIFKALGAEGLPSPSGMAGLITVILFHLVYGFILGALYNPPEDVAA